MLNCSWMSVEVLMTSALIPIQFIRINILLIHAKGISKYWYFKDFEGMFWDGLAFFCPFSFLSVLMKACLQNLLKKEVFSQIPSTWMMLLFLCYLLHLRTEGTLHFLQPPEEGMGLAQKQHPVTKTCPKRTRRQAQSHLSTAHKQQQNLKYHLSAKLWLQK